MIRKLLTNQIEQIAYSTIGGGHAHIIGFNEITQKDIHVHILVDPVDSFETFIATINSQLEEYLKVVYTKTIDPDPEATLQEDLNRACTLPHLEE